ncbi:intraflagellar transport protein 140 [Dorcoceras hygrometricum]|uniref:Intraflagellar transport protein 140 n=1 Tax=Dorcoceras hygrometricum TaxID=472368 RepID=A0A2Z7BR95_9LAMI|nr:intraflagellar transport protein 140 [Dorcoceras hygrometricum]
MQRKNLKIGARKWSIHLCNNLNIHRMLRGYLDGVQAPGSDQFHEDIGTSTVERLDRRLIRSTTRISTPPPVCTRKPTKISWTESPRRDGRNKFRQTAAGDDDGEGRREREEFAE